MTFRVKVLNGTNIGRVLDYSLGLIESPAKTIVVMVTDLYEGGNPANMYAKAKDIIETGARLIILTALDSSAVPAYDKKAAQNLKNLGAEVAALTPNQLAKWIAQIIS